MKETMDFLKAIIANEEQSKMLSKVCGRENYVITLQRGRVIFAGTKGKWKVALVHTLPLSVAATRQNLFFTYKKDFLQALEALTK